jgi:hypothetical protein
MTREHSQCVTGHLPHVATLRALFMRHPDQLSPQTDLLPAYVDGL